MPNKDYTAVVLVVDRSGSMSGIAATVQGALEEFVNEQLQQPGRLTIDTVFFDTEVENRASFVDPKETKLDLSVNPRGMTALFDAVGLKIDSFGLALAALPEDERPGKVIFVIATDGHENSSREITQELLAAKIKTQQDEFSWDFTFIGANQDAVLTAEALNIPKSSAITFAANDSGADNVIRAMSTYVSGSRMGASVGYSAEDRAAAVADLPADSKILSDELRANLGVRITTGSARTAAPKAKAAPKTPRKAASKKTAE